MQLVMCMTVFLSVIPFWRTCHDVLGREIICIIGASLGETFLCVHCTVLRCVCWYGVTGNDVDFEPITDMMVCDVTMQV